MFNGNERVRLPASYLKLIMAANELSSTPSDDFTCPFLPPVALASAVYNFSI